MAQVTTVVCPRQGCHCEFDDPLGLGPDGSIEIEGDLFELAVTCPRCGGPVVVAREPGRYIAVGGRYQRIAKVLTGLPAREVERLLHELQQARDTGSRERAEQTVREQVGLRQVLVLWRPTTHEEFWALVDRIVKVLLVLATFVGGAVQADDVAGAVAEQLRPPSAAEPDAPSEADPAGPGR